MQKLCPLLFCDLAQDLKTCPMRTVMCLRLQMKKVKKEFLGCVVGLGSVREDLHLFLLLSLLFLKKKDALLIRHHSREKKKGEILSLLILLTVMG